MSSAGTVWCTGNPGGYQYTLNFGTVKSMPYKDPEVRKAKHKEYSGRHYQKNKDAVKLTTKTTNALNKIKWQDFKASLSCSVCGFSHPAAMDFHHPPGTKKYGVHDLVSNRKYAKAYKEAAKCIVLCANCHRIHHFNEKGALKEPPQKPTDI